ncbi:DUF3043 domain-containing protein [Tessaracoccus caeni]|uniref:DUF3043 domain-containing protein n=1 Tax=Tessaracoccus caeni TaxID=3031239 RepID=UPI0023DB6BF6|nr:DUF3043 domain-containing protein [Tessaracoccus caeni]MDF1486865.1 DUF3043 domain-containing protein [Tessaracoccus caeni]
MGLFRPYERTTKQSGDKSANPTPKDKASQEPSKAQAAPTSAGSDKIVVSRGPRKKEGATPTRREAEAARMERLHPTLTPKQQRKADREARYDARMQAMDRAERAPHRALLRDFVDARWTIAEFMMPAMILMMSISMATMMWSPALSNYIALGLWLLLLLTFVNIGFMWRSFKKVLQERHPGTPTKGLLMYMFNRALMIRRFRRPAARIKRGDAF